MTNHKEEELKNENVLSIEVKMADANSFVVSYHPTLGTFFHFGAGATAKALMVVETLIEKGAVSDEKLLEILEPVVDKMSQDVSMHVGAQKEFNKESN